MPTHSLLFDDAMRVSCVQNYSYAYAATDDDDDDDGVPSKPHFLLGGRAIENQQERHQNRARSGFSVVFFPSNLAKWPRRMRKRSLTQIRHKRFTPHDAREPTDGEGDDDGEEEE